MHWSLCPSVDLTEDCPGGPDFFRLAEIPEKPKKGGKKALALYQSALEAAQGPLRELYQRACYDPEFVLPVAVKRAIVPAPCVAGHIWGGDAGTGPQKARVMLVGKWPNSQDVNAGRLMQGIAGEILEQVLQEAGFVPGQYLSWYVTNVCHHPGVDPASDKVSASWSRNWAPVLAHELAMVQPDVVVCLGREAADAVLGDDSGPMKELFGRQFERSSTYIDHATGECLTHTYKVMAVVSPASVQHDPVNRDHLLSGLNALYSVLTSGTVVSNQTVQDWRVVYYVEELEAIVDMCIARGGPNPIIFVDCEWHGEYPNQPHSYLRTIQFSDRAGFACCVVLRHAGGAHAFCPSLDHAVLPLRRLLMSTPEREVRVAGHHLRADLPRIHAELDPVLAEAMIAQFAPADTPEGCRTAGGFDTMIAAHAYRETGFFDGFKLEYVCQALLGVPRWNIDLETWLHGKSVDGYGDVPDEILHPYALADVAYPRELVDRFLEPDGFLDADELGNECWTPFWNAQRGAQALLEMEMTGVHADRNGAIEMCNTFQAAADDLTVRLREAIQWPSFNVNSPFDVREFLFGEKYRGAVDGESGRPEEAISLYLPPVKSSGKPSQVWSKIVSKNQEHLYNPSTDKEVLGILLGSHPTIGTLRDLKFVTQMLKMALRPPAKDKKSEEVLLDENGEPLFDSGLIHCIQSDSRIYTHFFPTAETGRLKSARPNLQNLCLDKESEYLTSRGWVPVAELLSTDEVAQFWPQDGGSGEIDFVVPSEIHVSDFDGNLVHLFREQTIDLLVTPDHRCLLRSRGRRGRFYKERPAKDFSGDYEHVHAGNYRGGPESLSADKVIWLTAVQADGNFNSSGGVVFSFVKQRKIDRLTRTMQRLGIEYATYADGSYYVGVQKNREILEWTLSLLGKEKQFGSWLLRYDRPTLELFAAELCHWDGTHKRQTTCFSSNRQSADWYQIIWSLTGQRARMSPYVPKNERAKTCWIVNRPGRGRIDFSYTQHIVPRAVPYRDKVYCVTVPSGWIVVRRNGVVSVTGNSKRRDKDYERILGQNYKLPLRALIAATPPTEEDADDPWLLVDFDLRGAELFVTAIQSGDETMIDHCQRSNLPESDPAYHDIHSSIAVQAFNLRVPERSVLDKKSGKPVCDILGKNPGDPLPATKTALKLIGRTALRTAAKCVVIGSRLLTTAGYLRVETLCQHLAADQGAPADGSLQVISDVGVTPLVGLYNGGVKPCLTVKTVDGFELSCTHEHQFRVLDTSGNYVWRRAGDLAVNDWVAVLDRDDTLWDGQTTLPSSTVVARTNHIELVLPATVTEEWAAFLGLYVAEGSANPVSGLVQITLAHEEDPGFVASVEAILVQLFGDRLRKSYIAQRDKNNAWQDQTRFVVNSVDLARWLSEHASGDSWTKVLPETVFSWPSHYQRVFLRWLFAGDGPFRE
jgi:uracil-DNA glycosylase family 4